MASQRRDAFLRRHGQLDEPVGLRGGVEPAEQVMSIEDMTVRQLSDQAANQAKAERADPNDATRAALAKEATDRIMQSLGLKREPKRPT
jgi:hypothetical protein